MLFPFQLSFNIIKEYPRYIHRFAFKGIVMEVDERERVAFNNAPAHGIRIHGNIGCNEVEANNRVIDDACSALKLFAKLRIIGRGHTQRER